MESLEYIADHRTVVGKLMNGWLLVLPWERAEDHVDWCDDLVRMGYDMGVDVWREEISAKSVTVIFNEQMKPSLDAITAAIAAVEHDRFMNRELGKLIVPGHRVSTTRPQ
jgi:hypothetical protein